MPERLTESRLCAETGPTRYRHHADKARRLVSTRGAEKLWVSDFNGGTWAYTRYWAAPILPRFPWSGLWALGAGMPAEGTWLVASNGKGAALTFESSRALTLAAVFVDGWDNPDLGPVRPLRIPHTSAQVFDEDGHPCFDLLWGGEPCTRAINSGFLDVLLADNEAFHFTAPLGPDKPFTVWAGSDIRGIVMPIRIGDSGAQRPYEP